MDEILKQEMQKELTTRILPYWMERMVDQENGGFYGRITGQEELMPRADKGAILNARILWTYSAAYRLLGREEYKEMANRAHDTDCKMVMEAALPLYTNSTMISITIRDMNRITIPRTISPKVVGPSSGSA